MRLITPLYDTIVLYPVSQRQAKNIASAISDEIARRLVTILSKLGTPETRLDTSVEISDLMQELAKVKLVKTRQRPSSHQLYEWMVFDCPGWYDSSYVGTELAINKFDDIANLSMAPDEIMTRVIFILDKIAKAIASVEDNDCYYLGLRNCMPDWYEYTH